jgi:hypothetical protein
MPKFEVRAPFQPAGDQPRAIAELSAGLHRGEKYQTLLGVTGSGKTMTLAHVLAEYGKPTLVLSHNKTLAAQLYGELKQFMPANAVEYFVSYYDYYQPEAYVPQADLYIEKDSSRNHDIDRPRQPAGDDGTDNRSPPPVVDSRTDRREGRRGPPLSGWRDASHRRRARRVDSRRRCRRGLRRRGRRHRRASWS